MSEPPRHLEQPLGDPTTLRQHLVAFGQRFGRSAGATVEMLQSVRDLIVALDEAGVPAEHPAVDPPPPVVEESAAGGGTPSGPAARAISARQQPAQLHVKVTADGDFTHGDLQSEPTVRTLKTLLALLAKQPVGTVANAIAEVAIYAEALELELQDLRTRLAAYES